MNRPMNQSIAIPQLTRASPRPDDVIRRPDDRRLDRDAGEKGAAFEGHQPFPGAGGSLRKEADRRP